MRIDLKISYLKSGWFISWPLEWWVFLVIFSDLTRTFGTEAIRVVLEGSPICGSFLGSPIHPFLCLG